MAIPLDDLFNSKSPDILPKGSKAWKREIFQRTYGDVTGPFHHVCQRIQQGFSVLVYLPGNCMAAAAETVKENVKREWSELGKFSTATKTMREVFEETTGLFERIFGLPSGEKNAPPAVIFHNLELLSDERGGLDPHIEAKTALLYLIDSARSGVVLGFSDRRAGELPDAIRRVFDEEIWLDEIPDGQFRYIIPRQLGQKLGDGEGLREGVVGLIAARLRWTDPIRAVNIMEYAAEQVKGGRLDTALDIIRQATRTVEFLDPESITGVDSYPSGYEAETIRDLQFSVIRPFQDLAQFDHGAHAYQRELTRLPPGLIFYGPPGTGKTRLAKWVAKSINLPVQLVSASDLRRGIFGQTEQRVKHLFRSARRSAPCVIVLDDADDLLPERSEIRGSTASAEYSTVNAFLQELEGFHGRLEGILVILTTNRYEQLDKAARERLNLHFHIPYPLDNEQVKVIVESIANEYDLMLDEDVLKRLVEIFMGAPSPTDAAIATPGERRQVDKNLYSPREIAHTMRFLIKPHTSRVAKEDVDRMESYLNRKYKKV